jgi:hypothetical protein
VTAAPPRANLAGTPTNAVAKAALAQQFDYLTERLEGIQVNVASAATVDIGAQASSSINITGTTTITSFGTVYSGIKTVRFAGVLTLTHNATTLILPTAANITTQAGDQCFVVPNGNPATGWQVLCYMRADGSPLTQSTTPPRSYLAGLAMSTAGASATMTVAAGQAANSTNAVLMTLAASIGKTTGAWAVGTGNGGLDTGAIANNTWYHFHLIRRPDTGVVDVLISLSVAAPTLPANYTQFRRIGSGRTNGSGQWVRFFQSGDQFLWDNLGALDQSGISSTSAITVTLTVPTGVKVEAILNVQSSGGASQNQIIVSDPDVTDVAPSTSAWPLGNAGVDVNGGIGSRQVRMTTNTSAQIRLRSTVSDASVRVAAIGWRDTRGRDA